MNITELDEWQGLTREMVDRYLDRAGWCHMPDPEQRLLKPQYVHVSFKMGLGAAVERITSITGSAPQALLRKINPRMRKGMPSEAARNAHDGFWLMRMEYTPPTTVRWENYRKTWRAQQTNCKDEIEAEDAKHCLFWPCDAEGNKVRWPEKDGVML